MKDKHLKNYILGMGSNTYQPTDYLGNTSTTANNNLSQKNSHSGVLQILGVNDLVFGIKDRNNQRYKIETDHDRDINRISENGSIVIYAIVAVVIAAVLIFALFKKK